MVHARASWARGGVCTGVRSAQAGAWAEVRGVGERAGARLGARAYERASLFTRGHDLHPK
ncbi:hypothetical protein CRG98_030612 [Punica granatum]|uniref:Uncharacterized protein n=1 Tax=Punica granatum TaxID=22663 RepID=A0A2I0IYJ8_PUNGR|nr:hypothetical protein CRG98_030612 [Punica granatum]